MNKQPTRFDVGFDWLFKSRVRAAILCVFGPFLWAGYFGAAFLWQIELPFSMIALAPIIPVYWWLNRPAGESAKDAFLSL